MPSFNPQSWQNFDLTDKHQSRDFVRQLSNWCIQMQQPQTIAGLLNSNQSLLGGSLSFTGVSSSVSTNQSLNTNQSALVFASYTWTGASNPTFTLTNLVNAVGFVRVLNSSGAVRTITVSATSPAAASYQVVQFQSGSANVFSSGVSVNNGASLVLVGMANLTALLFWGAGGLN